MSTEALRKAVEAVELRDYQSDMSASKLAKLATRVSAALTGQDGIDATRIIRSFFHVRCLAKGRTNQIGRWRIRALQAEDALATHRANYDALVIRLGEVTARLEAADGLLREIDRNGVLSIRVKDLITTHLKAADHV